MIESILIIILKLLAVNIVLGIIAMGILFLEIYLNEEGESLLDPFGIRKRRKQKECLKAQEKRDIEKDIKRDKICAKLAKENNMTLEGYKDMIFHQSILSELGEE